MYIKRHAEAAVDSLQRMFGAILVAGPRQVGKTTMLKQLTQDISYITLDDPILRLSAIEEGLTFFKDNPPPIFIDEVQKAPMLFEQIKIHVDKTKEKGLFYMCGSQQFNIMKGVSESLDRRVGITILLGLSIREKIGCSFKRPFIPTAEYFSEHKKALIDISYDEVWESIHRGSMPELCTNPSFNWHGFYSSYFQRYLERDVRELTMVDDEVKFIKFISILAARNSQLLNLSSISKEIGISSPTAERWLSILVSSNLVYLLRPYSNNLTNRIIKTPKLYFLDTGLVAYLTRWSNPTVLKNGAMAGEFFESFVVSEIIKSYYNSGIIDLPIYFYRDKDQKEIDLLIQDGDILHPIEIKKHSDPKLSDIKAFDVLDKIPNIKRGPGGVICTYDNLVTLKGNDRVIPISYI